MNTIGLLSAEKCRPLTSFWKNKTLLCGYSQRFLWRSRQAIAGLSKATSAFLVAILLHKANVIIWRYAIPCRHVIHCKIIDLE